MANGFKQGTLALMPVIERPRSFRFFEKNIPAMGTEPVRTRLQNIGEPLNTYECCKKTHDVMKVLRRITSRSKCSLSERGGGTGFFFSKQNARSRVGTILALFF